MTTTDNASASEQEQPFDSPGPPLFVNSVADLGSHEGADLDSWFFVCTGDADGRTIGFQVHCIVMKTAPDEPHTVPTSISVTVEDETAGWYRAKEYDYPLSAVSIAASGLALRTPNLTVAGDAARMTLQATIPDAEIDVTLCNVEPPLYDGAMGRIPFFGTYQYEYAFPAMPTSGTVTAAGHTYRISGQTWFDRQWGPQPPAFYGRMKWLWMNLQLDNGERISLWEIVEFDTRRIPSWGTIRHADGSHSVVALTVTGSDVWTSPASGKRYPTRFVVEIPAMDARLEVTTHLKGQEIVSPMGDVLTKYEAPATTTGTYQGRPVRGRNYVEMVGHWK